MTPSSDPSEEALRFLQLRVARFGLFAGSLCLFFWVYRAAMMLALDQESGSLSEPSMLTHLMSSLFLIAVWVLLQGPPRTVRTIRAVEVVGVVGGCSLLIAMGSYLSIASRPDLILPLALTFVLMSRAVYVPSSGRHTAIIGVGVGIALVLLIYQRVVHADPAELRRLDDTAQTPDAHYIALSALFGTSAWWTLSTALAVATSRVIYGLRKQVGTIKQLGQYRIEGELGAGGMGVVYRASHAMLRRETAVKLLQPERAGEAAIARFEREVKLTARLSHPNTVTIYDYGRTPEGTLYYAMELLRGATLEELVCATGPMLPARVAYVLAHTARALAEAHGLGLVHRDIKPANIMLCNQGGELDVVKVLDFGLVKELDADQVALTLDGSITGTPLYLSPEAIQDNKSVSPKSDLYALGAVGYYLLVGDHVFSASSLLEVCSKHLSEAPTPPSERSPQVIPERLERLILSCLSKKPDDRPSDAKTLAKLAVDAVDEPWDGERAQAWWKEHQKILERHRASERPLASRTIAVDWERRSPPAPEQFARTVSKESA